MQDGDRLRYQVTFLLYNRAEVPGIVEVSFRARGEGRRRGFGDFDSDTELARTVRLDARAAREIGIVLDSEPQMIQINTVLAENLPWSSPSVSTIPRPGAKRNPLTGKRSLPTWIWKTRERSWWITKTAVSKPTTHPTAAG